MLRYAILREDAPGKFEPTGETFECEGPDEVQARLAELQDTDPARRCHAAALVAGPSEPSA